MFIKVDEKRINLEAISSYEVYPTSNGASVKIMCGCESLVLPYSKALISRLDQLLDVETISD